jgi:diguanylate cyclase (GGDEF)-like protein/PAS domain S-box-containing protein
MLERFFLLDPAPAELLQGRHDPVLVLLSVGVAMLTSALALHLASLARQASTATHRRLAVATGGAALGAGIWAMHFIGMLAFTLCTPVSYDLTTTLLSMLPGLAASWIALWLLARPQLRSSQLLVGGALVGLGIGAMHYSGMAAMRLTPALRYDPLWFLASIVLAVPLAMLALWIRFGLRNWGQLRSWQIALLGSCVMGAAISGMHYTAMGATRFIGVADEAFVANAAWAPALALAVALTTAAISTLMGVLNGLVQYRDLYRQVGLSAARMRALVDTAVDGIITIDQRGVIQSFNRSAERIFGWTQGEVMGRNISMLMPAPYSTQHDSFLEHYMRTGEAHIIGTGREASGLRKDGSLVPVRLAIGRADAPGDPLFVGFVIDLSQRKQAEAQLRIAASVFDHSYEAVLILDEQYRVEDLNPAFERLTGLARIACLHQPVESFYPGTDFAPLWQTVHAQGHWQGELTGCDLTGGAIAQHISIAAVRDSERAPHHYIVVISDITQAKAHEQELERIALYDSLTSLPNRRLLTDRLLQGILQAQRRHTLLAVCYLDLDGFKQVNDQHGHAAGDLLLIEVSRRIQGLLRAEDTLARLGGDEMVLLMGGLRKPDDCLPALQRVLDTIRQPVALPQGAAQVSASMGLSIFPLDGDTPDLLLRRADHAMYEAKQSGKNQCRRFRAAPAAQPPASPIDHPV